MASKKVLIIDDVESMRKLIVKALAGEGYSTLTASCGSDGLLIAQESKPDLVLCDAVMPGMTGHELLRVLKRSKGTERIPVLIMSGEMIEEKDIVSGLEGGADDYLVKPFTVKILRARVRAVLRRYELAPAAGESLRFCGIELDPSERRVHVGDHAVPLTRKEFDLLALMLEHPGRMLRTRFLLETIWGYDLAEYNDPQTVQTHVSRLRKKLGGSVGERIVNVHGMGYRLES
ncbi:MAG: response regulator transcription factor [Elusimicrobia bacterium]|nr:response regulator transcription factor [Elusimicrobiota bacterium]